MTKKSSWVTTTDQLHVRQAVLQSTLSKRTLSKPDSKFGPLPAELHLYLCHGTLSKADTSLNRTVALVPRVSALERVDCIISHETTVLISFFKPISWQRYSPTSASWSRSCLSSFSFMTCPLFLLFSMTSARLPPVPQKKYIIWSLVGCFTGL